MVNHRFNHCCTEMQFYKPTPDHGQIMITAKFNHGMTMVNHGWHFTWMKSILSPVLKSEFMPYTILTGPRQLSKSKVVEIGNFRGRNKTIPWPHAVLRPGPKWPLIMFAHFNTRCKMLGKTKTNLALGRKTEGPQFFDTRVQMALNISF